MGSIFEKDGLSMGFRV